MKTTFKEVAKLYIGCEMSNGTTLYSADMDDDLILIGNTGGKTEFRPECNDKIKPVLRKLSDITEAEDQEWQKVSTEVDNHVAGSYTAVAMQIHWAKRLNFYRSIYIDCDELIKNGYAIDKATIPQVELDEPVQGSDGTGITPTRAPEFFDQVLSDLLVTALEGGSNNWYLIKEESDAKVRKYAGVKHPQNQMNCFSEWLFVALDKGEEIQIHDCEDEDNLLGILTRQSMSKAAHLLQDKYPTIYENILEEDCDAGDADIFFQLAVMGEVVYG